MTGLHTADETGRQASVHAGRAAMLIVAALVIGLVVLNDTGPSVRTTGPGVDVPTVIEETTTTTEEPGETTTTVAIRPPEEVKVIALNGTSIGGVAGKISDRLRAASYDVQAPGNATATAKAATKASFVYYTPGYTREALHVAEALGVAPTNVQAVPAPPPATDLRGANVIVLVKEDLANRPEPPPTTTTRQP